MSEGKKCKSYFGDYKCHVPTNVKDSRGRVVYVDKCLKEAVENFNANGLKTVGSCCGHGIMHPIITFADEVIKKDWRCERCSGLGVEPIKQNNND